MAGEKLVTNAKAEAEKLASFYTKIEADLLKEVNRALLKGNKTEYLATMLNNCREIIKELRGGSADWVKGSIPIMYQAGAKYAEELLKDAGKTMIGYGSMHKEAIKVLSDAAAARLDDVTLTIGRRIDDIYRTMALENVRQSVSGMVAIQKVAKNLREDLADRGITGFKDRAGRNWNMTSYSRMVARTTTMEAHIQGTVNRIAENEWDLVKVTDHASECAKCREWENKTLSISGEHPDYPSLVDARAGGLFHPNCFPAETLVASQRVLSTSARWYEGEMVVLKTASGIELSVTPNHPILSSKGWVGAGSLVKGDYVMRCLDTELAIGNVPDNNYIPTRIKDVVSSFNKSFGVSAVSVPISAEDFHGDGKGSEVCIISADSLLRDYLQASLGKPVCKNCLREALKKSFGLFSLSSLDEFAFGDNSASDSIVSSTDLSESLVGTHARHSLSSSLGATGCLKNSSVSESLVNGLLVDAVKLGEAPLSFSSLIATDEVVEIDVKSFSGHVYNLQTINNWYVANSIITHNCEHDLAISLDMDAEIARLKTRLK